ncbi:hypothetical protein C1646_665494 [Rhizophagus diaphanus]|nr:hypothetical protein C1646_665494 [Rhizophagus diaphanus] [Rhizophagus sp. MUCL 43196]
MYLMLKRLLKLKDSLNDNAALEHDLKKFLISSNEWDIIEELCRIFEKFYKATEYMSISNDYASKTNIINDNCENNNNDNDFLYELFGANNNNSSDEFEVEDYLNKSVEGPKTNPLIWWKVQTFLWKGSSLEYLLVLVLYI